MASRCLSANSWIRKSFKRTNDSNTFSLWHRAICRSRGALCERNSGEYSMCMMFSGWRTNQMASLPRGATAKSQFIGECSACYVPHNGARLVNSGSSNRANGHLYDGALTVAQWLLLSIDRPVPGR